jgi:hypothetical protein
VSKGAEDVLDDINVPADTGIHETSVSFIVCMFCVVSSVDQSLNDLCCSSLTSLQQRCLALLIFEVGPGFPLNELLDDLKMALGAGNHERSETFIIF